MHYFTPEEYLEIEQVSPIKHEYLQGQIVAMAGASKAHVIITGNLSALMVNHLRGSGCISYAVDMKVRLPKLNLFTTALVRDHLRRFQSYSDQTID